MNLIFKYATELLAIDSPSGYTKEVISYLESYAQTNNLDYEITKKGNLNIHFTGMENRKTIWLATHVDTLGLMVRSIKENGELTVVAIGGPLVNTLNGEYVKIYTRTGLVYEGTIVAEDSAIHVTRAASEKKELEDLIIRIDEEVTTKKDVEALGIMAGDFVSYDPKTRIVNNFIKSRFLDDKICAASMLSVIDQIVSGELKLEFNVSFVFSTYEEVGHGLSYVPEGVDELIAIDMACVGADLNGSEHQVTICAKDSTGPYDYDLTTALIELSKKEKIDFVVDIYPFYGSDASAARTGGANLKTALIGPGVCASHGMERTNIKSLVELTNLICTYIGEK